MKNTNQKQFPENHSSNQPISSSKRKILTSLGVSSGVLGASALSQHWVKPVVNSVILPAHAQMTTTPAPPEDATTPAPPEDATTPAPPEDGDMPRIKVVSSSDTEVLGDGESVTYHVSLTEQPRGNVTVTVVPDPATGSGEVEGSPLTFTRSNYMVEQSTIVVTAPDDVPDAPANMVEITFTASGGGYDEKVVEMLTIVEDDDAAPTGLMATGGAGQVTISWTAPTTTKAVAGYVVQVVKGSSAPSALSSATEDDLDGPTYTKNLTSGASRHTFTVPGASGSGIEYSYTVNAVYTNTGSADTYTSASSTETVSATV